jgi:sterol desaturase/sphingolipid hydroxylase (fatty acid hydroxylase superfamily)
MDVEWGRRAVRVLVRWRGSETMETLLRILANPWKLVLLGYVWHVLRYVLMAGSAYLVFYVLFRQWWLRRKIQAVFPPFSQMRREVLYSLLSFVMFALTGLLTLVLYRLGWSRLYFDISSRNWAYFWFSALALIVLHDAWFYWTHRLMHWRPLFPIVHRVHHLSHNPTPWASFAFHPVEALVQAIYFPLIAMVLPTHPLAAGLWLFYMTFMNVAGHLGYEFLPRGFASHRVFRWHNTPLHHNLHHSRVHCNFGLYFNLWDRLMGTNHPQYEAEYERFTAGEPRPDIVAHSPGYPSRSTTVSSSMSAGHANG